MIITIIVLLILAGVTIAAITGNENTMEKAQKAKSDTDVAEAKEAATLSATGHIADYMDKKYVKNDSSVANMSKGEYVADQMDGETSGSFVFETEGLALTVTKSGTTIITGTIGDNGTITWDEQQADLPVDPNSVKGLAQSGAIQRWDTINYTPGTGSINNSQLNISGAILNGTVSANESSNWVVLDVNETTGEVLIMPKQVSSTTLSLSGKDGYNNAISALNKIAAIYKNNKAQSSRSITREDIVKVENITLSEEDEGKTTLTWNHRYGMDPNTYDITDTESDTITPSQIYTTDHLNDGWDWVPTLSFGGMSNFWIATRYRNTYSETGKFYFCVGQVEGGQIAADRCVFGVGSNGTSSSTPWNDRWSFDLPSYGIIPVVSLKLGEQLESTSTFYTQTATATVSVPTQDATHTFVHHAWSFKE